MDEIKAYEHLDIAKFIAGTFPEVPKIPQFVLTIAEKILHVKEMDEFCEHHFLDSMGDYLDSIKNELIGVNAEFKGLGLNYLEENAGKKILFASNHPYGGPESITLLSYLYKFFPDVKLLGQSYLKIFKRLSEVLVFNKKGIASLAKAINENNPLLFYPSGFCSRMLSFKEVFDYEWKPGFIKIARKNRMPLCVIHTDGQLSSKIINWTKFRNAFHIKTTVETMYLIDEMLKLKDKTINFTVSPLISPEVFTEDVPDFEWASRLRQYCHKLGKNPEAVFDPSEKAVLPLT